MSPENSTAQSIRHDLGKSASWDLKGDDNLRNSDRQKELSGQARAQENEIAYLRWQIAQAYVKEMQLLNEKFALERKFSDLRMALDEKQKESITSALKELAHRKADLDLNVTLTNDLKDADEQRYIFMTSLLGLLAEHGILPGVANAASISVSVKHLQAVTLIRAQCHSLTLIRPSTKGLGLWWFEEVRVGSRLLDDEAF